jgi:hypothetical protein
MANSKQATAGIGLGRSTKTKHGDEAGASAPAPRRRAVLGSVSKGTLLVRDTHYQIKGLCSFMHDIQCYICQDWDGESMWHLKCRNAECSHLGYVCHTCTRHPGFEMKCSVCRGGAVFMKHDPTATSLMRKTALIECEQPECSELVTRGTMREHLETKCSFNMETCPNPGCSERSVSLPSPDISESAWFLRLYVQVAANLIFLGTTWCGLGFLRLTKW